ncbi:MAG: hypothetical protein IKY70_04415 [Bacteroidales bacterium]|nr:hypothetical protein [Bacteroidales bacterium]
MRVKYQYNLILYFLVALSILGLAFVLMSYNKEINYNLETLKVKLVLYNDIACNSLESNTPYDSIPTPANIRHTILDSNKTVLYDNFKPTLVDSIFERKEFAMADQFEISTVFRKSQSMNSDYLFYTRKFNNMYVRTGIECKKDIITQIEHEQKYIYVITLLFIALAIAIFYISHKLTHPLRTLQKFIEIVKSPNKDYSKIDFPHDEFGKICKNVIDTFDQFEQTKLYKQQLSQNVSHELKTPITAVRAYLETILSSPEMSREQILKFIDKAYSQSMRLSSLIYDVSTLNKLDERSDAFKNEEVLLSKCISEIRDELDYKFKSNNITLNILFSNNLRMEGCYTLIYSLFKNLIDNSIEHGGKDTVISIHAGINQIPGDGGYRIEFTYTDTGKGIPEEYIPRIFERFYRIEEGRTRKRGGTGLGLSIVRSAVLYHKGEISVENGPEGGVIFKFHLYSL